MVLAARGSRDLDDGVKPLADGSLAAALRRKALRITLLSIAAAAALTAAAFLVPNL